MNGVFDDVTTFISAFHFLRPLWLLLLPVILVVWWVLRRPGGLEQKETSGEPHIAPHLANALRVGKNDKTGWPRLLPIDTLALLLTFLCVATAGPAWSRLPNLLMARTAPLVLALEVTSSMTEKDVAPSRLERAKQKIYDLLDRRDGAPTALVAYAGTAHRVVPLTEDPYLMRPYVEGLETDVMPEEGNSAAAALKLAQDILKKEQTSGSILFLTDGIEKHDISAFAQRTQDNGLGFLMLLPSQSPIPGAEQVSRARVTRVTPDARDIDGFVRYFSNNFRQALINDKNLQWEDRGWWFAWPAAILALLWFRRGWILPVSQQKSTALSTGVVLTFLFTGLITTSSTSPVVTAQSLTSAVARDAMPAENTFLTRVFTPDQLGQWLSNRKEYSRAANVFSDTYRRGYAQYQAGQFEDAANTLAGLNSPEAIFTRAMAQVKSGQYQDAITGFEQVVAMNSNFPGADKNLRLTRDILAYMEKSRGEEEEKEEQTQSDQDNYDKQQQEIQAPDSSRDPQPVDPEQWMSTLDTSTSTFMKQRFAAEAAAQKREGNTQ
ncbi:VWA domain-containing protein [Microbulbifer sp. HZ11]|uniref:vWA domain-containing protein n=1 Tax=Microbulbifer sp. HZ11 TaxID=1453501 RepID=UPI0006923B41|nr:VWA domain-containing protein [Microbulbifer sp. HZ11]